MDTQKTKFHNNEYSNPQWIDRQIHLVAEGNKEALALLYQQTKPMVFSFLLSYLDAPDAEDALQDTYIALYQSSGTYTSQGNPTAWILGIAKNIALMKLRASQKTTTLPEKNWNLMEANITELSVEDRQILHQLLSRLSTEEYRIVILHAVSGLKFREIAEMLSLSLSTVLSKHHRAMKKLKNAWREELQ